jgi:hypothetical protein
MPCGSCSATPLRPAHITTLDPPLATPVCFFAHCEDEIRHPASACNIPNAPPRNVPSPRRAAAEARRRCAVSQLATGGAGGSEFPGLALSPGPAALAAFRVPPPPAAGPRGGRAGGGHPGLPGGAPRGAPRAYSMTGAAVPPAAAGPPQQRWSAPVYVLRPGTGETGSGSSFLSECTSSASAGLLSLASLSSAGSSDYTAALQHAGLPPGPLSRTISAATTASSAADTAAAAEMLQSLLLEAQAGRAAADTATAAALRADAVASLAASRALALAEEMGLGGAVGAGPAGQAAGTPADAAAVSPRWDAAGAGTADAAAMLGAQLGASAGLLPAQQVQMLQMPGAGAPRSGRASFEEFAAGLAAGQPPPGLPDMPGLADPPGLGPLHGLPAPGVPMQLLPVLEAPELAAEGLGAAPVQLPHQAVPASGPMYIVLSPGAKQGPQRGV